MPHPVPCLEPLLLTRRTPPCVLRQGHEALFQIRQVYQTTVIAATATMLLGFQRHDIVAMFDGDFAALGEFDLRLAREQISLSQLIR